jgi:type II secretory pathway pseudopilin PulG
MKKHGGFTILELVVVVVAIIILLLVVYMEARQ